MKTSLLLCAFLMTSFCYSQENDIVNIDSTQIRLIGNRLYKAHLGFQKKSDSITKKKTSYYSANNTTVRYVEIDLTNVLFKTSQSVLISDSYNALNALVILLRDNPKISLKIEGHTDKIGHSKKNLKLSLRRARAIRLYLFKKGIKLDRITANGFGDQFPICDAPCTMNQRVEFTMVSNGNEKRLVSRKAEKKSTRKP